MRSRASIYETCMCTAAHLRAPAWLRKVRHKFSSMNVQQLFLQEYAPEKVQFEVAGRAFDIEIRSVNHRHIDMRVRLPRAATRTSGMAASSRALCMQRALPMPPRLQRPRAPMGRLTYGPVSSFVRGTGLWCGILSAPDTVTRANSCTPLPSRAAPMTPPRRSMRNCQTCMARLRAPATRACPRD